MEQPIVDERGQPYAVESEEKVQSFEEIQRWLLKMVSITNDLIKNDMLGNSWVETENTAGWQKDPQKIRVINEEGASHLFNYISKYTNPSTLLANNTEIQQEEMMFDLGFDVIEMIGDNFEKWEIDPKNMGNISRGLNNYVWQISTRAMGGLDRSWFNKIAYNIQRIMKSEGDNKESKFPFFGQG